MKWNAYDSTQYTANIAAISIESEKTATAKIPKCAYHMEISGSMRVTSPDPPIGSMNGARQMQALAERRSPTQNAQSMLGVHKVAQTIET